MKQQGELHTFGRDVRNKGDLFPVVEIFSSIQFEGDRCGTPNVFIRFAGCNLNCAFCDTDITKIEGWYTPHQVLDAVSSDPHIRSVILTGGEPMVHDLAEVIRILKNAGYFVAMESNGTLLDHWRMSSRSTLDAIDWLTVSPKTLILPSVLEYADEVKYVVPNHLDLVYWDHPRVFLQPEWNNKGAQEQCLHLLRYNPRARLSVQTHKYLDMR